VLYPAGLRALNHRDFRVFFAAQLTALVGSWMQTVAQSWLVLQLTDSPLRLGLLGTLQFGPVLLLSLVSGAVADRVPKRRLLVATQATMAVQALSLGLLVLSGHVQYWHVAAMAVVAGLANALDLPTRQSFIVDLVGRDDLVSAVGLNSAAFNAARIVGPAVAGLLIARVGVAPAFVLNSLGFVLVVLTLLRLRVSGHPRPPSGTSMRHQIAEGLHYAARTPRIVLALSLLFAVSLAVFNFTVYVPLLARHVLGLGAEGFGFLMAALGVGAVAGALTVGTLGARQPALRVLFGAGVIACGGLLGLAAVRDVWTAVPILFVTGFAGIVLVAACNTTLQLTAPDALRGRVMSLYTTVYGGVFPIGSFLVGAISERWGVSMAFLAAGVFGLLIHVVIAVWWRRRRAR
jgi:predicted MFS family arabinose efflux permease